MTTHSASHPRTSGWGWSAPMVPIFMMCAFFSMPAQAIPITYYFSGEVDEFTYSGTTFSATAGEVVYGSFTYDADYGGEYLGGEWPRQDAILDWNFTVNGQTYEMTLLNPFVQIPSSSSNQFSFLDEQPGNSVDAAFFDQSYFSFSFSNALAGSPADLPVDDFLGGSFVFSGGSSSGGPDNAGAIFRGTFDTLTTIPEPASAALLLLGLSGWLMFPRRQQGRIC